MLAGQGATQGNPGLEQLAGRIPHLRGNIRSLEDKIRVQVAIARVTQGGDGHAVLCADGINSVKHRGQLRARYRDVFDKRRPLSLNRGVDGPAHAQEFFALSRVGRHGGLAAALHDDVKNTGCLSLRLFTVRLHEQEGTSGFLLVQA